MRRFAWLAGINANARRRAGHPWGCRSRWFTRY